VGSVSHSNVIAVLPRGACVVIALRFLRLLKGSVCLASITTFRYLAWIATIFGSNSAAGPDGSLFVILYSLARTFGYPKSDLHSHRINAPHSTRPIAAGGLLQC
jgi:hypothetical protein